MKLSKWKICDRASVFPCKVTGTSGCRVTYLLEIKDWNHSKMKTQITWKWRLNSLKMKTQITWKWWLKSLEHGVTMVQVLVPMVTLQKLDQFSQLTAGGSGPPTPSTLTVQALCKNWRKNLQLILSLTSLQTQQLQERKPIKGLWLMKASIIVA